MPPFVESTDLATFYRDHSSWLHSWLRRKTGCSHEAADLAQDTFIKLLSRPTNPLREISQPRAFLSTIARGLLIDHWRRRDLERAWLETLAALPEVEVPSPDVGFALLETLIALDRLLDTFKPQVRRAFLLARIDGMTCPEVARQMNLSLATVERYIAGVLRRCYELKFNHERD
jgi:RNA polymerase sigma factor (sigma-70 family)